MIYNEISLSLTKNEILLLAAAWMDPENIILNSICKTGKDYMLSLICWILKSNINISIYKIETENKLTVTKMESEEKRNK